jgi:cytochrome b561
MCKYYYPAYAKAIHLGLAVFGITAYFTGEFAENANASIGYLLHAYLGLSLAAVMLVRIGCGFSSSQALSFNGWSPFSRSQWDLALEDFRTLLRFTVPDRGRHQGLAGLTQCFGLIIFAWMAMTGTGLFILGAGPESDAFELLEQVHEVGETLIPLYLALHVGAVILHTISGNPIWKKMFMLEKQNKL